MDSTLFDLNFHFFSWASSVLSFFLIVRALVKYPYMIVKPSFMAIIFIHLQHQWSSAYNWPLIEESLLNYQHYFLLVHVFIPVAIISSQVFLNGPARNLFFHIHELKGRLSLEKEDSMYILIFFSVILGVTFWYLMTIPFQETGLYAIIFSPETAKEARENSLKLLANPLLKYAFMIMSSSIAPLLGVILGFRFVRELNKGRIISASIWVPLLMFILFSVSLYGGRAPSAKVLLTICFSFFLLRPSINFKKVFFAGLFVFSIPAILSIMSEGKDISFGSFQTYFVSILDRAFGRSIINGIWHIDYVSKHGFFGWPGIGRFYEFFGGEKVNVFNVVGLFNTAKIQSVSANTSYIIAYYSCFGLVVFVPCLFMLLSLDCIFWLYRFIPSRLLIPCVAVCQIVVLHLSATFFTTALISFGFLLTPFICVCSGMVAGELKALLNGVKRELLRY